MCVGVVIIGNYHGFTPLPSVSFVHHAIAFRIKRERERGKEESGFSKDWLLLRVACSVSARFRNSMKDFWSLNGPHGVNIL